MGDFPSEGTPVLKEVGTSLAANKGPSDALVDAPVETPVDAPKSQVEKEDPACGEKK
ncbi:UNVERIFIED_CONTAM: hypothetical protein Slati_0958600 [Sesamum latifolium]|uniref:Uncharacterized protein n=1 Tax=Sesamum latifolium TaxID=2727402 RepID=A0AAW2XST1_9LAMI